MRIYDTDIQFVVLYTYNICTMFYMVKKMGDINPHYNHNHKI